MCKIFEKIFTKSSSGTKIVYWNMLADKRGSKYFENLTYEKEKSEKLLKKERKYSYFHIIIKILLPIVVFHSKSYCKLIHATVLKPQ